MLRRNLNVLLAAVAAVLFSGATASAQLLPAVEFTVPYVFAVSHPCQTGFVLINGSTKLRLTAQTGSKFTMEISATGTGTGEDAGADGLPLATGALPYTYSSAVKATSEFLGGTPAYFGRTLTLEGEMLRDAGNDLVDVFGFTVVVDLEFNNGIPTLPVLKSLDVSCP